MTGPQNAQANNKLRACYIGEDLFLACIFILWTAHFNKDEDKKKKKNRYVPTEFLDLPIFF